MQKRKKKLTKTGFIRQHPDMTPSQVEKAAKEKGWTILAAYVSHVRHHDKHNYSKKKRAKPEVQAAKKISDGKRAKPLKEATLIRTSDIMVDETFNQRKTEWPLIGEGFVRAFKAMIILLGTQKARELLKDVEDETSKLFGRPPL